MTKYIRRKNLYDLPNTSVAIYSPWIEGHNSTYIKCYAESFIRCGCRVRIFVDNGDYLRSLISFEHLDLKMRPAVYDILKFKNFPILSVLERILTRRLSILGMANQLIQRVCKQEGDRAPDLVFFPSIDTYFSLLAAGSLPARMFGGGLSVPWIGHYTFNLEGNGLRNKASLRRALCQDKYYLGAVLIGDAPTNGSQSEHLVRALKFPDVTDLSTCQTFDPFLEKIHCATQGRYIVSLLGNIADRKGLSLFLDLVASASSRDFFFLLVGRLGPVNLTARQQEIFDQIKKNELENCIGQFDFIQEDLLNSIIELSDLIFLVYRNFLGWSNLFTKAMHFRRKVLVSKGTQMSRMLNSRQEGVVIPENDLTAALAALTNLHAHHESGLINSQQSIPKISNEELDNRIKEFLLNNLSN